MKDRAGALTEYKAALAIAERLKAMGSKMEVVERTTKLRAKIATCCAVEPGPR